MVVPKIIRPQKELSMTSLVDSIYSFLALVGFTHPLHPMVVHVPMGMIIGMFIFALLALRWKDKHFEETAYYCSIVSLVFIGPVIAAGILDWLHRMQGEWSTLIVIKMILGTVLTILLAFSVFLKVKGAAPRRVLLFYLLCLACAGGLGYTGGELVYG
jgi:uncharacterized membrane protein